jgi:hypothetical protein
MRRLKFGVVIKKSGYGIQKSGYGIQKSGYGIQKSGYGIQKSGYGIQKSGHGSAVSLQYYFGGRETALPCPTLWGGLLGDFEKKLC